MTTFMTISDTNISNDNNCDCISFNALNYLRQNNPQTVGNSDQNMTKIWEIFWRTDLYEKQRLVKNLVIQEYTFMFLIGCVRIAPRDWGNSDQKKQRCMIFSGG